MSGVRWQAVLARLGAAAAVVIALVSFVGGLGAQATHSYTLTPYVGANGAPICDAVDTTPPYTDIACNPTDQASVYVGSDGTTLTFGFVLSEDPSTTNQQAPFESTTYVVAVAVNGTQVATVGLDAKGTGNTDQIYVKCAGSNTLNYTANATTALSTGQIHVAPEPGGPVGMTRLTFTVPLSALAPCGVTSTTAVQLYFGSSQAGNLDVINKDLFFGNSVTFTGLSTISFSGNLGLSKTFTTVSGPATPTVGQTSTYDLVVTASNPGAYPLSPVSVTDTIPAGVTIVSTSSSAGTVAQSGQSLTWSGFSLAPGGSATMTIRVSVTPTSDQVGQTITLNPGASGTATRPADGATQTASSGAIQTGVVTGPRLSVTKTVSPTSAGPGDPVTYTITINSTGTAAAEVTTVVDDLPAGFTFVPGSTGGTLGFGAPTVNGSQITWTGSTSIPAGQSRTLTFSAVLPASPGTGSNTATVSGPLATATTGPTAPVTVVPEADLAVAISDTPDPVLAGAPITYTASVTNNGPSPSSGTLRVALPSGVTFTSAPGCSYDVGLHTVSCATGALAAGGTYTATITVTTSGGLPSGTLTATASVTSPVTDLVASNNTATAVTAVQAFEADLSTTITDSPDPVAAGNQLTHTVTVTNAGPAPATGTVVTVPLPAGLAFVSAPGCTLTGSTVTCPAGDLAAGSTASFTVTTTVAPSATGTVSVTATSDAAVADPDASDDSATATTTVNALADLALSIADVPDPVVAGTDVTYTISVTNTGPSTATGVVVTDVLPAGLTFVGAPGCSYDVGTRTVSCSLGSVAPGATVQRTITATVASSAGGTITNTASVSTTASDPDPTDDAATASTSVTRSSDLSVSLTDAPDPVVAGTTYAVTATVGNAGPSDASATSVTFTLPAGTVPGGPLPAGCTAAGQTVTCTLGTVVSGGTASVTIPVDVDPSALGALTVTATAASGSADPDPSDDTASTTTTATASADLAVVVSAPATAAAGLPITIDLTVTNAGPSTAVGAVVTAQLPGQFTNVVVPAGCTYDAGTSTVTCAVGTLVPGAGTTISVQATVATSAAGPVTTTATVSSGTADPDPADNTDSATTTVAVSADLAVDLSAAPDPVVPGTTLTYTVVVTGNGPGDAAGATVSVALPAGVTPTSLPAGCTFTAGTVTCSLGTVAAGQSATRTITTTVAPGATGNLVATATADALTADPLAANDTDSVSTSTAPAADIAMVISDAPDPVVAGTGYQLTATASNTGPSTATGVVVTISVPAGTTVTATSPSCSTASGSVTCTIGTLAPGSASTATVDLAVAPSTTGTLSSGATVTAATPDPDLTDNAASTSTAVATSADLTAGMTVSPDPVVAGTPVTFTATASNTGPSSATGVVVTIQLPAGVTSVSVPSGCTYDAGAGTVTCTVTDLAPGATVTLPVTAVVSPGTTGSLTATSTVTAVTADPDPADNTASDSAAVATAADLVVTLADVGDPVTAGTSFTYRLTVTNTGPSTATGTVATIELAPDTSPVALPAGCSFDAGTLTVTCLIGALAPGAASVTDIDVAVAPAVPMGTVLTAVASATSTPADPVPADNTATESTTVRVDNDVLVELTASPDPVTAGQTLTYTAAITNVGPSDATNVVLTFELPAGVSVQSSPLSCSVAGSTVNCTVGTVPAGTSTTVVITAAVAPATTGSLTTTATVTADGNDPVPANNADQANTTVEASSDLAVTVTLGPDPVVAGTPLTATIAVTNTGPSTATGVVVTATLPPALGAPTSLPAACTFDAGTRVVTCTVGTLAPGATASFAVTSSLSPGARNTVAVSASVTTATPDPDPSDNTAVDSAVVVVSADLSLALTGPATVVPGTLANVTLTVTNQGPSDADSVVATVALPPGVTVVSTPPGCTVAPDGASVTCLVASIGAGQSAGFPLVVAVDSAATGTRTITAGVDAASPDADPTDDAAALTMTLVPSADLSVNLTASPDPVAAGTTLTHTIEITNSGPSDAVDVSLTFTSPAGTEVRSIGDVPAGATVAVIIAVPIAPGTPVGVVTSSATVASPTPDPDGDDNTATETTTVASGADLSVSLTDSPDPVIAGTTATFTAAVTNAGPSDASATSVRFTLPAGVAPSGALPSGCIYDAGTNTVTCAVGTLAPGASASVSLPVLVDPSVAAGSVLTTSVAASSGAPDGDPSDNVASADTTVATAADLAVDITDSPDPATPGLSVDYTVSVTNAGPSDAEGVSLTFTSPAGTEVRPLGDIAAGATVTVTITVPIDPAATGSIGATASVSSATVDPDSADNAATESTALAPSAGIAATATGPATVVAGEAATFVVGVTNAGPSTATSTTVTVALPAGFTPGPLPAGCVLSAPSTVTCTAGAVAPGAAPTFAITGTVSPSATGTLVFSATADSATPDADPSDDTATHTATVTQVYDLAVSLADSPDPVAAGTTLRYTATVTNAGPSDAAGITLTFTLPGEVTPTGTVTQNLGTIAAGATVTVTLDVAVDAGFTGSITATATVPGDSASATTTVAPVADLALDVAVDPTTLVAGETATITVTVTNLGPSTASGVVVTMPAPPGTTVGALPPLGDLAPGQSVTFVVPLTVAPSTTGPVDLTASVASGAADPDPANNAESMRLDVTSITDIGLTLTAAPDPVIAGRTVTFTAVVTNAGPSTATAVSVVVPVPAGTTAGSLPAGCTAGVSVVTCVVDTLDPGASASFAVPFDVGAAVPAGTVLTSTAAVGDVTATASATVATSADLSVSVTATPDPALAGEGVTYRIVVTNAGPSVAVDAVARFTVPAGVTLGALPAGCTVSGTTVTCAVGAIAPGGRVELVIPATVAASTAAPLEAVAEVTSSAPDPAPADNRAALRTTVVNEVPSVAPDIAVTTGTGPIVIDLLGNDLDPEGTPLRLVDVSGAVGTVVVNADGTITYTPAEGFVGLDEFNYTVCDEAGMCSTGRVSVSVAGQVTELPRTGGELRQLVGSALLLLGLGFVLVGGFSRRRARA